MGGATPAPPPIFLYTKGTKGTLVEGTKGTRVEGSKNTCPLVGCDLRIYCISNQSIDTLRAMHRGIARVTGLASTANRLAVCVQRQQQFVQQQSQQQ